MHIFFAERESGTMHTHDHREKNKLSQTGGNAPPPFVSSKNGNGKHPASIAIGSILFSLFQLYTRDSRIYVFICFSTYTNIHPYRRDAPCNTSCTMQEETMRLSYDAPAMLRYVDT